MLEAIKSRLVADWRECLKWSSVRLNLLLLGLSALAQVMPYLDPNLAALLPAPLRDPATGIYAALILVARLTKLRGQ